MTLGTGVGGGVIVGGRLLGGVHGCGGELGHIKVHADEPEPCGCGKRGCLEQYASATGLVRTARALLEATARPSALREIPLDAKAVFDCARAGDALALEAVEILADSLGQALTAVSCVCDPEIFVLGGGVSAAGDILLQAVEAAFRRYAFPPAEGTRFALARLGNEAGIYGCAKLALDAAE
ncbi:MAG: ROK family protein [Oscillospiraceae bacterium]|nr:ROK family protein [Oscillospiraceae bacterium]